MPVSDEFAERVLEVVDAIPPGRVMTYGDIAACLGSRASRAVGQVMAHYGSQVPWWRVIRASGQPPACHEGRALEHYLEEGTALREMTVETASLAANERRYRINLRIARWSPLEPEGGRTAPASP